MAEQFKFPDEVNPPIGQEEEQKFDITVEGENETLPQIEVVDDTPPDDRGRPALAEEVLDPTDEELSTYSEKVQTRIKQMAHARHDERRLKESIQREAAETQRVAKTLLEENKRLKEYVSTGEKQYQTTLTASAEAKLEVARRKFKEAHEAYDSDALLEAQQALNEAQYELIQAKNFKPPPLQAPTESVYNALTGQEPPKPDDKTLRWQQRNQWFGQDDEMTAVALIQHKNLVASGSDPRSDEYFGQIDARMRKRFPEFFGERQTARPTSELKRPASVVAPTTRSTGAKKITLTQTQVALAKKFGLTNEQYAASVLQMENANGR